MMKKKLIALALSTALLMTLGGWVRAANERNLPELSGETEYRIGSVPAEGSAAQGMIAPINAAVLCMLERDMDYDAENDTFRWASLYYMLSLYGEMDDRAELTDGYLFLPGETAADYASALFADGKMPDSLPEELRDWITFDSAAGIYQLARGDAGLAETRLSRATPLENGSIQVTGALVALEDETDLCRFSAELVPTSSMFGYAISSLQIL